MVRISIFFIFNSKLWPKVTKYFRFWPYFCTTKTIIGGKNTIFGTKTTPAVVKIVQLEPHYGTTDINIT